MTMPLSVTELDGATPASMAPFSHMPRPTRPSRERLAGMVITAAAHIGIVAALVFGIQVARPALMPKAVTVEVLKTKIKPEPVAPLPLIKPSLVTVPEPIITIAPPPAAPVLAAAPVRATTPPVPASPAPAQPAGEGRDSFQGRLLAQLQRFKHYPPEARSAHIEGVVMLHFIMDRSGKVLSADIAKSSGRPALDREALALVHRAEPLPVMPDSMPGATFEAVVPVDFALHD